MQLSRMLVTGAIVFLMSFESGCSRNKGDVRLEAGISLALAADRADLIHDVRYDLSFSIPNAISTPIAGHETIRFRANRFSGPLVLDFDPGASSITSISSRSRSIAANFINGHIVVPNEFLAPGENSIEIAFRAGDAPLNRNSDFLYALFVPARAHFAFPCFDQPDVKARYTLELTVPAGWQPVSNGAEVQREITGDRARIRFAETKPIPTYLFTFAAGKFQIETAERNGRTFRMFHRENDANKVKRNLDAIFDLHARALAWLKDYTQIPYPFGKFDFVLIPSFQFGGMEHPGAIYYNASSILLDESATENQMLGRANTISHETTHMWFGDLVTMRWFNDVWMKEVFANFMAAKIVNPSFPKVNHELRFLLANYPSAYGVDRTAGTHPIRQELENLNQAGQMYGPIIYQKAPIVMRQLELMVGPDAFRDGLRDYLKRFQYGNATWLDLVNVLGSHTDKNLVAWSKAWVEEGGRPKIRVERDGRRLAFIQSDPLAPRALRWMQEMHVLVGGASGLQLIPIEMAGERTEVKDYASISGPTFVLPTGGGLAYGDFVLDDASRAYLLQRLPDLPDPLARGAGWVTLWEEALDRRVHPAEFVELGLRALPFEDAEQNVQWILGHIDITYWRFMKGPARLALASKLEQAYRQGWTRASSSSLKSAYFRSFRSIVRTKEGLAFLERVWRREEKVPGLKLAEPDEASIAQELAIRSVPNASEILEEQRRRFQNADRKAQFEFVLPALSQNQAVRDAFFESLHDVKNRRHEPWAVEALGYLNHPSREMQSEKYIGPALDLLAEVQRTGDIFFPKNWMDAVLSGHNTSSAMATVKNFLAKRPDYPVRLRRIILQSADELFRAVDILKSGNS